MGEDAKWAMFLESIAAAAESDDDEELHRIGTRLLADIYIDPRFGHLHENLWHGVDLTVSH